MIGADGLDPDLLRTLALVHRGYDVEDQLLRAQFGMDSADAQTILRTLVSDGWLRYPSRPGGAYRPGQHLHDAERDSVLLDLPDEVDEPRQNSLDERILEAVRLKDELDIHGIALMTGSTVNSLRPRVRVLVEQGALIATAPPQSRNRRYRRPN